MELKCRFGRPGVPPAGDTRKQYVAAEAVDSAFLDDVREAFGDEAAIYVLRKRLSEG